MATNLVPGTGSVVPRTSQEVYVHDLTTRQTELISVGRNGATTGAACLIAGWLILLEIRRRAHWA
jgi:hypothetical protein